MSEGACQRDCMFLYDSEQKVEIKLKARIYPCSHVTQLDFNCSLHQYFLEIEFLVVSDREE